MADRFTVTLKTSYPGFPYIIHMHMQHLPEAEVSARVREGLTTIDKDHKNARSTAHVRIIRLVLECRVGFDGPYAVCVGYPSPSACIEVETRLKRVEC